MEMFIYIHIKSLFGYTFILGFLKNIIGRDKQSKLFQELINFKKNIIK